MRLEQHDDALESEPGRRGERGLDLGRVVRVVVDNRHAARLADRKWETVFAEIVRGQICGFGVDSYLLALRAAVSAVQSARA